MSDQEQPQDPGRPGRGQQQYQQPQPQQQAQPAPAPPNPYVGVMMVATFLSTSIAMRAEKTAKTAGLEVKLIPTPRHISADCGTALRFHGKDRDTLIRIFTESKVDYSDIKPLEKPS